MPRSGQGRGEESKMKGKILPASERLKIQIDKAPSGAHEKR